MSAVPSRRAALGAVLMAGACLSIPVRGAAANEESEIFALRVEHERLMAARAPLNRVCNDLSPSFSDVCRKEGWDAAVAWGEQNGQDEALRKLEEINVRDSTIAQEMIALRPKTPAGLAAVAATLKEWDLSHYWTKPDIDMDWDVMLITRFLDGLIELGQAQGVADHAPAQGEEARA
jgi:hypothetical protein